MPLFSIIIPTFNRSRLIGATLRSVLDQTGGNFEVIVVDDGSTDDTLATLEPYRSRVKIIQQTNSGPGAARARGASDASGQYVAFLDSDDLWLPWSLATYQQAIQRFKSPAVILGTPIFFTEEQEIQHVKRDPFVAQVHADFLATSDRFTWFSGSSIIIRKDVLDAAGGVTTARINADDFDLLLRVGSASPLIHVTAPSTVAYRRHVASAMGNISWCHESLSHVIRQEFSNRYPGGKSRQAERRRMIAFHGRATSVRCAQQGRADLGWDLYKQLFSWHCRALRWKYLLGFPLLLGRRRAH